MIKRIAHICIRTNDLKKSVEFYTSLGFTEQFMFTRKGKPYGAYLKIAENNFMEIFEEPDDEEAVNTGILHFCFESDNLDALMGKLDAQRIEYTPKIRGCDNTCQIWLKDPDGNSFEVHQYTPESMQFVGGSVEADWLE